jgi:hypothetical protein
METFSGLLAGSVDDALRTDKFSDFFAAWVGSPVATEEPSGLLTGRTGDVLGTREQTG